MHRIFACRTAIRLLKSYLEVKVIELSFLELAMIVCFGISWPISILKSYRSGSTKGKSLAFMMIIWLGYVAGILHKLFFSLDLIIIAYGLNLLMVTFDILLYFRNRRKERVSPES